MLLYRYSQVVEEMRRAHSVVREILYDLDEIWQDATGLPLVVTDVARSRAETVRIYEEAGQKPPRWSVHETDPVRGIDCSDRIPHVRLALDGESLAPTLNVGLQGRLAPYGEWHHLKADLCRRVAEDLNATWRYHHADRLGVCLWHDVQGSHFHLQCRPGYETKRR